MYEKIFEKVALVFFVLEKEYYINKGTSKKKTCIQQNISHYMYYTERSVFKTETSGYQPSHSYGMTGQSCCASLAMTTMVAMDTSKMLYQKPTVN